MLEAKAAQKALMNLYVRDFGRNLKETEVSVLLEFQLHASIHGIVCLGRFNLA
jgi:hypothetical protein